VEGVYSAAQDAVICPSPRVGLGGGVQLPVYVSLNGQQFTLAASSGASISFFRGGVGVDF
jgi:hypothetical protein